MTDKLEMESSWDRVVGDGREITKPYLPFRLDVWWNRFVPLDRDAPQILKHDTIRNDSRVKESEDIKNSCCSESYDSLCDGIRRCGVSWS